MKIVIEFDVPEKLKALKARVVGTAKAVRIRLKYIGRDIPVPRTDQDVERIWEFEKYMVRDDIKETCNKITHLVRKMKETKVPRKEYALAKEIQLKKEQLGALMERIEELKDVKDIDF